MRVRRVPKQNASVGTSVRASAWQKRSSSRAWRSIEPEMSHSRTTPRGSGHAPTPEPRHRVAARGQVATHHLARCQERAAPVELPAARPAHRHPQHHPVDEPLGLPQLLGRHAVEGPVPESLAGAPGRLGGLRLLLVRLTRLDALGVPHDARGDHLGVLGLASPSRAAPAGRCPAGRWSARGSPCGAMPRLRQNRSNARS